MKLSLPLRIASFFLLLSSCAALAADYERYPFTTLAGNAAGGYVDAVGSAARFRGPHAAVADRAGNIFVADRGNAVIRKITPDGAVSTFAGGGSPSGAYSPDGVGAAARFNIIEGVAIESAGNRTFPSPAGTRSGRSHPRRWSRHSPARGREFRRADMPMDRQAPRSSTRRVGWSLTLTTTSTWQIRAITSSAGSRRPVR